jgi:Mn2+/Fe2+ NRAMP family transporter
LFAYIITAIIVEGNWSQILIASVNPQFELSPAFAMMFVAILGTTITPYLFFWQASQEAEEDVDKGKVKEISEDNRESSSSITKPMVSKKEIKMMRSDTAIGMAFSQVIMWAKIATTSGSLHAHNFTNLQIRLPNAGEIAKTIFALGIIGTGLLAIPVMAGSSAYALSDSRKQGLNKKFKQAKAFYSVIAASTTIGLWINFSSIYRIKASRYIKF